MAAILSASDVVDGVLDAVNDEGARPPTARRLAARLHVAPATLYSAIPAMGCAYQEARTKTIENALGAIVDAFARGRPGRLAEGMIERPNEALFMTDPGVILSVNPMIQRSLERVGIDESSLGDLLALVGSLFTRRDIPSAGELESRADAVVSWYRSVLRGGGSARLALAAVPEATLTEPDAAAILSLAHEVPRVDPGQTSRRGSDAEAARRASAEIIIRSSGTSWSFRELSRLTDIPVTRLHRYGSRYDHLARAAADLLAASRQWANTGGSGLTGAIAAAVQTGLADVLVELYRSSRAVESGADAIRFEEVLAGVLSSSAVAVMAARRTAGCEPAAVVGVISAIAEAHAA